VTDSASVIETDALVIGAGPVGLFQVFQLGLLGINAHVVDSLPYAGGQCIELYPDKPIYDIPGTPRCTGRELTASLLKQVSPFKPHLHLGQEVSLVEKQPDGRFQVATTRGSTFITKTIFIAAGVGAFQPKRLKLDGLEKFEGGQLLYRVENSSAFADKDVLIVGGDHTALGWAMRLATLDADQPKSVTLLHRRDVFQADADMVMMIKALCELGSLHFKVGQVTGIEERDGQLTAAHITGVDGSTAAQPLDAMLVLLGLSPKLGPVANWGLDMARRQVAVDTEKFSTSVPGIFAVGDINTYPGKKKLILCGFHEAALAAFGAAGIVFPGVTTQLQYTTTSSRLHKLLGVDADASLSE
jgi:thioredoxin reductase (NADPH)